MVCFAGYINGCMKSSLTLGIKYDYQRITERVKLGKLILCLLQIPVKTTLAIWLKLSVTTQNS